MDLTEALKVLYSSAEETLQNSITVIFFLVFVCRFCVNSCPNPSFCTPEAIRYNAITLPQGFPSSVDVAQLIPYLPPSVLGNPGLYCQFSYSFAINSSPFGIKQFGNHGILYTTKKLDASGMYKLQVTADLKYADGTLACRTEFTVYIDVAKYRFQACSKQHRETILKAGYIFNQNMARVFSNEENVSLFKLVLMTGSQDHKAISVLLTNIHCEKCLIFYRRLILALLLLKSD